MNNFTPLSHHLSIIPFPYLLFLYVEFLSHTGNFTSFIAVIMNLSLGFTAFLYTISFISSYIYIDASKYMYMI